MCPLWRHFVGQAPDLTAEGTKNAFIDIELRDYLLQGAYPKDEAVLTEKHFQGGFLMNFRVKVPPVHGKVTVSPSGRGFRYHPSYNYVGDDDFYYVLNNGSQNSNIGKISLTVKDGLDGTILVSRLRATSNTKNIVLRFTGKFSIPADWPYDYDFIQLSIIETRPIVGYMDKLPYVFDTDYYIQSSTWAYDKYRTPVSSQSILTTNWQLYSLPYLVDGYYPYTQQPYPKPIYKPWPAYLRVDFYKTPVILPTEIGWDFIKEEPIIEDRFAHWVLHHQITIDVVSSLGADWYENGTVQWIKYGESGWPINMYPSGL